MSDDNEWVELYYDPSIPAICTSDGRKVRYVSSVSTGQTATSKPGHTTGSISMKLLPIMTMGAYRQFVSEAQDRVETYLGKPEEPEVEEPEDPY